MERSINRRINDGLANAASANCLTEVFDELFSTAMKNSGPMTESRRDTTGYPDTSDLENLLCAAPQERSNEPTAPTERGSPARDIPHLRVLDLQYLMNVQQFLLVPNFFQNNEFDYQLSSQASQYIRQALNDSVWPYQPNFFNQGCVQWLEHQLNLRRPVGFPELRLNFLPGHTSNPIVGQSTTVPPGVQVQYWTGSRWQTAGIVTLQ